MATPFSFGTIRIGVGPPQDAGRVTPETPFRILVMGDFSGRASRGVCAALEGRKPVALDRDNFENVLAKMQPSIRIDLGEIGRMTLPFSELDDFRPERLYRDLEIFDKLRSTRDKLEDGRAFAPTAKKMQEWRAKTPPAPASGDMLEQLMAEAAGQPAPPTPAGMDWNNFLEHVVGPHVIPKENPRQAEMIEAIDQGTSGLMRALLHQQHFQALEAAWRGLWFLVKRLPTDTTLKISLLDVSRAELAADLAREDLDGSQLYRIMVKETVGTPGAPPWAVVAGLFTFAATRGDAELLGRIARIAQAAGAPFLAAAHSRLAGVASLAAQPDPNDWMEPSADEAAEAWSALRDLPEAAYLGLALPRFLLRLPYGPGTDEVDGFHFDEQCTDAHESFLWGNPALACACLLGQSFAASGWALQPGQEQEIENLPAYVYKVDDEPVMKPCAEIVLGVAAAQRLLGLGLMPLLSIQGRDAARLGQFLALSGAALAGRWH